MWIELRGRQHRVYWRTRDGEGPRRQFLPFATRDDAEAFIALARLKGLDRARWYLSDPTEENFELLFPGAGTAVASEPPASIPSGAHRATITQEAVEGITAAHARPSDRFSPLVEVTFDDLWERFLSEQRHVSESMIEQYKSYYEHHFQRVFGPVDLGLIKRARPLRKSAAIPGAVYVDDWVEEMLRKPKLNNFKRPIEGTNLSFKTIKNVLGVLAQILDLAVRERPALLEVNPAKEIRLPKQDRREMHFLEDGRAFESLLGATHEHFRPLLGFLVGTGARFGEAAGLLAKHVHLDAPKPYIEIRVVLKWVRKKWRLGRPKTASSVRRISLSPKLVELLRPLILDRTEDDHVFTMVEGGPLHHGNFHKRYFRPAVEAAGGRVPRKLRIHDLRHTHAAWLLSAGAPLIVVQRRLGHSTIVTTSDIYGHLTPEADKRSLRIVDYYLPDCFLGPDARVSTVKLSATEAALPEYDVDDFDDLAA